MNKRYPFLTLSIAGWVLACALPVSYASAAQESAPVQTTAAGTVSSPTAHDTVVQRQAVTVKTKTIKEETELWTIDLDIPVLEGLADEAFQKKWNERIEQELTKGLDEFRKQASEDKAQSVEGGYDFHPYDWSSSFEVKSDGSSADGSVLSILVQLATYTGGAHGMEYATGYNIRNEDQAHELTLPELFGEKEAEPILKKQVQLEIAAHPDEYFEPEFFTGSYASQSFYIERGKAVLVFNPYEIAPYAAGIREITVMIPDHAAASPAKLVVGDHVLAGTGYGLPLYTRSDGKVLIPLRPAAEALGYKVAWNGQTQSVEVSKGNQWTSLQTGKDAYTVNKMAPFSIGAAPMIRDNGSLYVPASFFSEVLKAEVEITKEAVIIR